MSGTTGAIRQHPPRIRVRLNAQDEGELYCYGCHEWLPMSIVFWPARDRLWRCRACEAERSRLYQARRSFDPEWRERELQRSSRYRAYLKGVDPDLYEVQRTEKREQLARRQRVIRAQTDAEPGTREYKAAWQRARRAELRAAKAA